MATTVYGLDAPRTSIASKVLPSIGRFFSDALHSLQYARLLQGMSLVSDAQLKSAGLSRAELLRRGRINIYGYDRT